MLASSTCPDRTLPTRARCVLANSVAYTRRGHGKDPHYGNLMHSGGALLRVLQSTYHQRSSTPLGRCISAGGPQVRRLFIVRALRSRPPSASKLHQARFVESISARISSPSARSRVSKPSRPQPDVRSCRRLKVPRLGPPNSTDAANRRSTSLRITEVHVVHDRFG